MSPDEIGKRIADGIPENDRHPGQLYDYVAGSVAAAMRAGIKASDVPSSADKEAIATREIEEWIAVRLANDLCNFPVGIMPTATVLDE